MVSLSSVQKSLHSGNVLARAERIAQDPSQVYKLTAKGGSLIVVSNGSAVGHLGEAGALACLPLLEEKCRLLKRLAKISAFPLALDCDGIDEFLRLACRLTASVGGLDLAALASPDCFEIESRLQELCPVPVFLSRAHGLAAAVLAALLNALKLADKDLTAVKIVVAGAGAAGQAVVSLLLAAGAGWLVVTDTRGAIYRGRPGLIDWSVDRLSRRTNPYNEKGDLKTVLAGADVFIGLAGPDLVTADMLRPMRPKAIVLALACPRPEIEPSQALAAGALVAASGHSDFPNRLRFDLGFPGLWRGALDAEASRFNQEMKLAAAQALASLVSEEQLRPAQILPSIFNRSTVAVVAKAVAKAAQLSGVARRTRRPRDGG